MIIEYGPECDTCCPGPDGAPKVRRIVYAEELIGPIDMEYSTNPATQSSAGRHARIAEVNPYNRSIYLDAKAQRLRETALANIR